MPEDIQTPHPGTASGQTPGGTETSSASVSPQPSPIDYYQKFTASSAENQRIMQENVRLQQEVFRLQTLQQAPVQSVPARVEDTYGEFADAVIDRKPDGIRKFAAAIRDEVLNDMSRNLSKQQRIQSSIAYVQSELKDPNSTVARQTMERYQQIASDPTYGYVEPDTITVGGIAVNPHLLRIAALEVKARLGSSMSAAAADARNSPDSFVEPSTTHPPVQSAFNPRLHLSEEERAYCLDRNVPFETYWKNLDDPKRPSLREARLKAGRPLKQHQI